MRIDFFIVAVLTKRSILFRVLDTPMNTAEKYSLNDYWWALARIEIKGYIGTKRFMSCLHIHVFILFCFLWFFKHEDIFLIWAIIHFIGTGIAKKICWLCLFSKCTKQNLSFIGNALLKSYPIYLNMCTLVNLNILITNQTGFSFGKNFILILGNFGGIN